MASQVTGEAYLAEGRSDPHLTKNDLKTPNSAQHNSIISQPRLPSLKRRKSKPTRFDISQTNMQKDDSRLQIEIVPNNPSSPCLSLQKENPPTKGLKTPLPSSPAMIQAMEVQYSLGTEFPSCIKMMVKSQVSCGFWMGLPLHFCKSHLPKEDAAFVLEDENGEQCEVKYIAYKYGLSGGWKKFAIGHHLIEGDVLLFHLVEITKFKVYIFKANDSNEVDDVTPSPKTKENNHPESLALTVVQNNHKKSRTNPCSELLEVGSELLEVSRPNLPFHDIKSFEDFHIIVKGLCIDHELPDDVRTSYYKLCFYKKQFLHENLPEGLYYKLVAGMIGETVSIANEIKNCDLAVTKVEFETWDNSLKSFEILGMEVGFLRDKIRTLEKLMFESEGALDIERYVNAKNEQKHVEDEMKKVARKLLELDESYKKLEQVSGLLKQKAEKYEHKFEEEIDVPW